MGSALRIGCILIVLLPTERYKTQLPLNLPLGVQIAYFVPLQVLEHLHLLAWQDIASQYSLGPGFRVPKVVAPYPLLRAAALPKHTPCAGWLHSEMLRSFLFIKEFFLHLEKYPEACYNKIKLCGVRSAFVP